MPTLSVAVLGLVEEPQRLPSQTGENPFEALSFEALQLNLCPLHPIGAS